MDRQEAAALCRSYQPGARIALRTLVTGTVVETDPERGCIWFLPDGADQHDARVWASEVQPPAAAAASTPSLGTDRAACGCTAWEQQHCRGKVSLYAEHPDCPKCK